MATPKSRAAQHLKNARRLYLQYEHVRLAKHPKGKLIRQSSKTRDEIEVEAARVFTQISDGMYDRIPQDEAIRLTQTQWQVISARTKSRAPRLRKANQDNSPSLVEVEAALAAHADNIQVFEDGAVAMYLGFIENASTLAGQHALDYLGLNKTFAWAHPRAMANDTFSVRGSKLIQDMYGSHINQLARIIVDATNPAHPKTLTEVRAAIRETWDQLQPYQVARIARTETAAMWTRTATNAYVANGIQALETIVATGPSVGVVTDDPCPECVDLAASGPFEPSDDLPPWHPNCRCEVIPVTEGDMYEDGVWLPPDEPFTGTGPEAADLDAAPEPGPNAAYEAASEEVSPEDQAAYDAEQRDDTAKAHKARLARIRSRT